MSTANVEQFVRDLIAMGGIYTVDDNGYVVSRTDDANFVTVRVDGVDKRLLVAKETITDKEAAILNPLNENLAETVDSKWLYIMLNAGLSKRVTDIARILSRAIEHEASGINDNAEVPVTLDTNLISFAAKHKDFNSKVFDHFELLSRDKLSFIKVWYVRKMKEARIRSSVFDPDTIAEFPQIKQKSWKAIISFVSDIFGVSKDPEQAVDEIRDKYFTTSALISVPRLESVLSVYLKIYTRMNRFLELCDSDDPDFMVDITTLGHHLANLESYYKKAKWLTTATLTSIPSKVAPLTRVEAGPVASNIPSNPVAPHQQVMIQEPVSGIPSNPRRCGLEYAEPLVYHQQQQFNPGMVGNVYPTSPFGQVQQGHMGVNIPITQMDINRTGMGMQTQVPLSQMDINRANPNQVFGNRF